MKCKFCDQQITWINTVNGKMAPVEMEPYVRDGSEPLPKGRYFDKDGNFHEEKDVPCKIKVWRSHWADCPGANQARKVR